LRKKTKNINVKKSKKIDVFFIFLFLSSILWIMSKLSKEFTHTVTVSTNYVNFSNDKELHNSPIKSIDMVMKTSGFNLLRYSIINKSINIDLNKTQKKGKKYFFLTNSNISSLQDQLKIDETVLRIYPDTIFFDFGKLSAKEIIINPKVKINYKSGYGIVGDLDITPKKVIINGSNEQIKSINSIDTKYLELKNITEDFEYKLKLEIPKEYHKINFSTNEITIKGIVEKFTQASLEVPFKLINVPKDKTVTTFLKTVKITYIVSLDNYDKIIKDDFKVVCDYDNLENSESNFLIPMILEKPNLISKIKVSPKKIEFLIKK